MITDTEARRIASEWHGGGGTALYAFASTGAIDTARADHDIWAELTDCERFMYDLAPLTWTKEDADLDDFRNYLENQPDKRGPQPGWGDLSW